MSVGDGSGVKNREGSGMDMVNLISTFRQRDSGYYCEFITHFLGDSQWNLLSVDRGLLRLFRELGAEDQIAFRNGCRSAIERAIKRGDFKSEKDTLFFEGLIKFAWLVDAPDVRALLQGILNLVQDAYLQALIRVIVGLPKN